MAAGIVHSGGCCHTGAFVCQCSLFYNVKPMKSNDSGLDNCSVRLLASDPNFLGNHYRKQP